MSLLHKKGSLRLVSLPIFFLLLRTLPLMSAAGLLSPSSEGSVSSSESSTSGVTVNDTETGSANTLDIDMDMDLTTLASQELQFQSRSKEIIGTNENPINESFIKSGHDKRLDGSTNINALSLSQSSLNEFNQTEFATIEAQSSDSYITNSSKALASDAQIEQSTEQGEFIPLSSTSTSSSTESSDSDLIPNVTAITKNQNQSNSNSTLIVSNEHEDNEIETTENASVSASEVSSTELNTVNGTVNGSTPDPSDPSDPDPALPPLPPEPLQQSQLHSLLTSSSSESLQKFLKAKGFSFDPKSPDPVELNRFLSQIRPKQGRFDPALLDLLQFHTKDINGFIPNLDIFGETRRPSTKLLEKPKENTWIPANKPAVKPPFVRRNRFSSKFSRRINSNDRNESFVTTTNPPRETLQRPGNLNATISHITDPNIRNHRLYGWELQNFTSIDQAEDLLAESSEMGDGNHGYGQTDPGSDLHLGNHGHVSVVKPPPGFVAKPTPSSSTEPEWIPGRPVSMEGTHFDSSGDLTESPPTRFHRFPEMETEEDFHLNPFSLLRPNNKRPREPLRESSTENLVLSETSTKVRSDERPIQFRPSPKDKTRGTGSLQKAPVFVDPEQDFFTSTIRSEEKPDELRRHPSYYAQGKFTRPSNKPSGAVNKKKTNRGVEHEKVRSEESSSDPAKKYPRKGHRKRRPVSDEDITDLSRDPRPYPPSSTERIREVNRIRNLLRPLTSNEEDVGVNGNDHWTLTHTTKKDRILLPQDAGYADPNLYHYHVNGAYPQHFLFGPASNEDLEGQGQGHQGQHYDPDPEDLYQYQNSRNPANLNRDDLPSQSQSQAQNIYAGPYNDQYHHPFAAEDNQPEYSAYHPTSNEGWSNTYWILGGLIALSAVTAFVLPTLLGTMGRNGKVRNDLLDESSDYPETPTPSSTSGLTSTITSFFTGSSSKPTNEDDEVNDTDLWTEIKGVYNDVVKILRGDYGGIVDKLSGASKDQVGPTIVYRDDLDSEPDIEDESDHLDEEIDFDYHSYADKKKKRKGLKHRKGASSSSPPSEKKKNRNISSSINYVVTSNGNGNTKGRSNRAEPDPADLDLSLSSNSEEETGRSKKPKPKPSNDSLAKFYPLTVTSSSSSSRPFAIFTSPQAEPVPSSTDGFLGEWAKVQLIGS